MKVLKYLAIVVSCLFVLFILFEIYVSSPYSRTDIYKVYEENRSEELIISCVVNYNKMQNIIKEISLEYNLSSRQYDFPTRVTYTKDKREIESIITYNDSEVFDLINRIKPYHENDGVLDIIGDEVGFALYDKDFAIFTHPSNKEQIINILEKQGLQEKKYVIKSRHWHFHKAIFTNSPVV